ncbi:neurotrophin-4 [Conger conger]|uniref:neurotrophin-4 n=1 Tax=Conger conger TaxID=82655 RepID=UPI002A5A7D15|nr:neurotrophin-4 [Conger conger]
MTYPWITTPQRTTNPRSWYLGKTTTLAPDEPYDDPEKQIEAETEGKEAAIEGGWAGLEVGGEGGWAGLEADGGKLLKDTELLFLDAHPRVLFTPSSSPPKHPPLLLMLEAGLVAAVGERDRRQEEQGEDEEDEGGGALMGREDPKPRPRRASPAYDRRGERSVCEVANEWVTDKKTAIDIRGNTVTVLPEIQTPRGPLKQYFFETKCRPPDARGTGGSGLSGRDCVGVDKKHWVSECKAKQSYVRALTTHPQKGVGWRWIRIDSSCVCVLQARVPRS